MTWVSTVYLTTKFLVVRRSVTSRQATIVAMGGCLLATDDWVSHYRTRVLHSLRSRLCLRSLAGAPSH